MGSSKSLLRLGSLSVLERVVGTARRAGIDEIVVVTGHEAEGLAPVLGRLGVREARNDDYDRGMFSSVRTGAEALPANVESFFVFPVDYALVGPAVLERLMAESSARRHGVLHPCCCGRRGHPPLVSGRYRKALLEADDLEGLDGFLRRTAEDQADVEVADATVLMDMDTADDYQRMIRFAAALDAISRVPGPEGPAQVGGGVAPAPAGDTGRPGAPALSAQDGLYLLMLLGPSEQVVKHCLAVAEVATALARAIRPLAPTLDVGLVFAGALLHDMARSCQKHALAGREILANLGLDRLAEIVGAHMVLPPEQVGMARVTEEQLVYLADKLVIGDQVGGLELRAARTLARLDGDRAPAEALRGMGERMRMAQAIQDKVEGLLGRCLAEVLP